MDFEETRLHNLVGWIVFGFVLSNICFIFANLVFFLPFSFCKSCISSSLLFLQLDISSWEEVRDQKLYGTELVQVTTEEMRTIKDRIKAAQDIQKKYADVRRRPLEFSAGDQVFLKVAPWKNILWFGLKGKLTPRVIRPFKILQRVGPIAYKVDLPPQLAKVHDVFHVSLLRKADVDLAQILVKSLIPLIKLIPSSIKSQNLSILHLSPWFD